MATEMEKRRRLARYGLAIDRLDDAVAAAKEFLTHDQVRTHVDGKLREYPDASPTGEGR